MVLLSGCSHAQRLVRSLGVVKQNPVSNHSAGMLDGLESVAVYALLFEGSNHALHNAILFGAVGRDEFLLQTVAAHQCGIASGTEHQSIV